MRTLNVLCSDSSPVALCDFSAQWFRDDLRKINSLVSPCRIGRSPMIKRVASVGRLHPFYYRLTLQKVTNLADLDSITSKRLPITHQGNAGQQAKYGEARQIETPSGLVQLHNQKAFLSCEDMVEAEANVRSMARCQAAYDILRQYAAPPDNPVRLDDPRFRCRSGRVPRR
jgi:hypothetical protein